MNKGRRRFLLTCWGCGLAALPLQAQTRRKGRKSSAARRKPAPTPPLPEGVLAELVPARITDGGLPREATALSGSWSVDPVAKVLQVAPTPLLDAWLEFGPEIREKGAQITASGQAPHRGRILSRLGVGLYGKNGFQLRTAPAQKAVELVRRGAVLLRRPFESDPAELHHLELTVGPAGRHWMVSGRLWLQDETRPEEPLFQYKAFADELQFPLAGRSVLFATPFSGEAVRFTQATVRKADGEKA